MLKIEKKKLILINNLVRVNTAVELKQIDKYMIELNKEDNALYIIQPQANNDFSCCLKMEMDDVKENCMIPISDPVHLNSVLTKVITKDEVELTVEKNKVIIESGGHISEMPAYKRTPDEEEFIKNLMSLYNNKDYGEKENKFVKAFGEGDDFKPESKGLVDLNKLNIKNLRDVYNVGTFQFGIKKDNIIVSIGIGKRRKNKNVTSITTIEDDPEMEAEGDCVNFLQDISVFTLLSKHSGYSTIYMSKEIPIQINKKIGDIGVSYMVGVMEDS